MELSKKISEEIKEVEESGEKDINKKSSKISSETKNDENIDSNMKRTDTINSFALKTENSNNINNETNKSESENNNKNKEYINTNSSERKGNKKKTAKAKDNMPMILSVHLLEIMIRNKEDMNIIFKRKNYKNILEDIKKTNNYFEIYKAIQEKEIRNLNEIIYENKKYINKPILMLNVSSKEEIELEFYKHGSLFKNPIRQRFGIITNGKFYSSIDPIEKFNVRKAKEKTMFILNAREIIKEDYEMVNSKEWHNEDKKFRIRIIYNTDDNKINNFLIYFFEEKERDDILELIKLMRLKMTIKEPANVALLSMEKKFNQKNKFYMILKILAVKRKLKNQEKIKEYINNDLEKDKNEFDNFVKTIKSKIKNKYIEQKKFLYNKGIQRINKCLFMKKEISEISETNNYSLKNIKEACNNIYRVLKKPYYINDKIKMKNNFVSFKVKSINFNNNYYSNNELNLCFNYDYISINYSEKISNIFLDKDKIFEISNVIYNFNLEHSQKGKYNMAILGPFNNEYMKNENNFNYNLIVNKNIIKETIYNKYNYNDNDKFDFLVCQIFNIEINKIEIKNLSFISSITEKDYFYIKILGGFDNNLITKTKLFNPKIIKDKIIIEFNLELFISYEFFGNKDKSIKVILYHINHSELGRIDNSVLLLDYMNKIEVKQLNLKLDSFMNMPSYEMPFDECVKSKIFWNLIVINNNDISKNLNYIDKSFKIGNKFFYLENIEDINNEKDMINYYKYEKIERYLQKLKNKEYNNKLFCLCEYLGMNNKEEIVFFNLLTGKYKYEKYDAKKFILFSNNNFNIINNEILCNFNNKINENFIKLFKWYKIISFENEIQMLSFLEILKKLRRLSVYDCFYQKKYNLEEQYKNPYGHEINENLLYDKLKGDEKSKNNFRFILELNELELKNNYNIDKDSNINIEILSRKSRNKKVNNNDINTNKLNLFNIFMNNAYKYENSFLINNKKIDTLKVDKINNSEDNFYICFINKFKLNRRCFDKRNERIINLNELEKENKEICFNFDIFNNDLIIINLDWYHKKKQKHMYILIDINKDIFNSILIKPLIKKNKLQNENLNLNDIYADNLILPVFVTTDNCYKNLLDKRKNNIPRIIAGILTFKIICFNLNPKYLDSVKMDSFEERIDKNILDYIKYHLDEKDKIIAIYEPNIFKNNILSKLIHLYNKKEKTVNNYLESEGILVDTLLPDFISNNEKTSRYFFNKFKKHIAKFKRNIIYNCYIDNCWERLLMNKNNVNNYYENFPSKEELLDLYKKNDNLFYRIKDLIHMGLPNINSRIIIWNKLLNIKDLVNKTGDKLYNYNLYDKNNSILNENEFIKKKGEIYCILYEALKTNESEEYLSLIDNIIDLDIINLKHLKNNLDLIKNIVKIFYQWTLLNIGETSNANAIKNVSKIKNLNEIFYTKSVSENEYSYYSGVLYLCEKLFEYFKSPSETFWYLIGLSQVIPMFNINYNLYELTIYNLVIKLILEQHHPKIYQKFVSLNFPFEYFFSKHITYYYSSFFNDIELFMKIMDILIFESAFSIETFRDPINHLRFLCTIILTIIVENEDKIISAENIYQLENLFKILKYKKYNMRNFFETINYNIFKYFDIKEKDELALINNNWEYKRISMENILDKYYYSNVKKIYSYMQNNFRKMSLIIQNNKEENLKSLNDNTNRINVLLWKEKIRRYLYKKPYNGNNNNNKDKTPRNGLLMIFREIKTFNFLKKKYGLIGECEINIFPEKKNNPKNKITKKIIINDKGNIINNNGENEKFCLIDYKYHFKEDNILIISFCNQGKEYFRFRLNIDSINLLNPIKLEIHSYKSSLESTIAILEISILKYCNYLLNNEYCNLFLLFFSPNEFKIDNIINSKYLEFKTIPNINELICEEKSNLKFEENLHKNIYNIYHQKLSLIYQYYLDRNFLCSNKKYNTIKDKKLFDELKLIINELFLIDKDYNYYSEKIINLVEKENSFNNITIMEILISIYLDNNKMNLNMNDILYNLYNFSMISNKKNICTISNIVELVYIIYKKYSIFYEFRQVKSMVNYYFKKEKFSMIKSVLIYKKNINIENIIDNPLNENKNNLNLSIDKHPKSIKSENNKIKKILDEIDVTSEFFFLYNNFSEICEMFDFYNKSDLNPQSKNNIILILKIILYNISIKHKENPHDKKYDYNSFEFIIIEYNKEYTYEQLCFSINYNSKKHNFDIKFSDENNNYGDLYIDYKDKIFENKNIYELILLYANSNFLLNNYNNEYLEYNISFNDFKNIFSHLPYLNDILYKSIYKIFSGNNYKLISNQNFKYDKISVSLMNDSKKMFEIIFVSNSKNKNYLYNSNFTRIYNSIIINYNIYSNFTIKKIFDIIINKVEYQNLNTFFQEKNLQNYEKIKDSISDFHNITFYTIDENNKYIFLEPLLPLYINFPNTNKKVISFYLDITYSFFLKSNNITKYKGYYLYPMNRDYEDAFQWRKCSIFKRENENYYKIEFKCFKNMIYEDRKLINLNLTKINQKFGVDKNENRFGNIMAIEKEHIKNNLLIDIS